MLRFLIYILAVVFISFQTEAKVCFLPDVMGNNPNCLGELAIEGCSYTRTTACGAGYNQSECTRNGKKYYDCRCKISGSIKGNEVSRNGNTKYHCDDADFVPECGCPNPKCNRSLYPFTKSECESQYPNTLTDITQGDLDYCLEGDNIYLKECKCPSVYQYECKETGLKAPSTNSKCKNSNDKTLYQNCECADSWVPGGCENNTNGCTVKLDRVERSGIPDSSCYLCGPETCDDPNQINLNGIWCSTPESDCNKLGFSETTPVQCGDNSTALSCPFDVNYRFCPALTCAVGDVFYADGTCGKVENYTASKMPIGVVFMLTDGNGLFKPSAAVSNHGKILSLKDISVNGSFQFDPTAPFGASQYPYQIIFGYGTTGSSLIRADEETIINAYKDFHSDLYKGKEFTALLAQKISSEAYCSAITGMSYAAMCVPTASRAALAFYPHSSVASDPKFGAGNWYIPSMGELVQFAGTNVNAITAVVGSSGATKANVNSINTTLERLKSKGVTAEVLQYTYYSLLEYYDGSSSMLGNPLMGVDVNGSRIKGGSNTRGTSIRMRFIADF